MVIDMPKRAYWSGMREAGFDYKTLTWKIHPLFGASAYRTALTDILGPDLCVDKPYRICLKEVPYLGWIGSWQYPHELREQIVETQRYTTVDKDNILLQHGTSTANTIVTLQTLDWNSTQTDHVILFNPTWFQFNLLRKGLKFKATGLWRDEKNGWKIDMEALKEAITPQTKLIMVNSPNNPTGQTLSHDEMKAICEIGDDNNVRILSDEIYRGLEWGPNTANGEFSADWKYAFSSPAAVNYSENAVSTASVSKTCSCVGVKMGWMATQDKEFMQKCFDLSGGFSLHLTIMGKLIATALTYPTKYKEIVSQKRAIGAENWKLVYDWIKQSDVFSWTPPEAGFLSFPYYNLNITSSDMNNRLIKGWNVWLQAGSTYASEYHQRLGVGRIKADGVKIGLKGLGELCEQLKKENLGPQEKPKVTGKEFLYT